MKEIHKSVIKAISELHFDGVVFQVGGSLLPHKTRDYDLLIYCTWSVDKILKYWGEDYVNFGSPEVRCYEAYDQDDTGKAAVIKLKVADKWIDLMYVHETYLNTDVVEYMKYIFPISAQRVAKNIKTGELHGVVDVSDITFWCNEASPYLQKYLNYYHTASFKKVERGERCI